MATLVFQATLGGQVNLNGPNTASTFNIAVPATTGNMVTTGDSGTVTSGMLASSVYTAPGTIGSGTANTGAFTSLSASSTVSGAGFSTYLASPPAIGGTAAAAGSFTALSYSTTLTGGTGIVNLGSGQFYKDASGNVGIGTASPTAILNVYNATSAIALIQGDSGSNVIVQRSSADASTPNYTFRKSRGTVASPTAVNSADGAGNVLFTAYGGTNYRQIATIAGIVDTYTSDTNISGTLTFNTNSGGTSVTEWMRITSTGSVGIGTTSPVDLLQVNRASGSGVTSGISLTTGAGAVGDGSYIKWTGAGAGEKIARIDGVQEGTDLGSIRFNTGNGSDGFSERVRIDSSGNVGIGTSSPSASAILDAQSTTKGVRMPNMTTTQKNAISSPAAGLMVFDTTLAKLCVYSGSAWQTITST